MSAKIDAVVVKLKAELAAAEARIAELEAELAAARAELERCYQAG